MFNWLKTLLVPYPVPISPPPVMYRVPRSGHWETLRNKTVDAHPYCAVCGCRDRKVLAVHHKKPYHKFPELELDPNNLIVLCESPSVNCHILFGHLKDWSSWNIYIDVDAKEWAAKIKNRPPRLV